MAKIGSESRQLPLDVRASMIEVLKGTNGESVPKIMDPRTALPGAPGGWPRLNSENAFGWPIFAAFAKVGLFPLSSVPLCSR
jgi:hypothetical protein